MTKVIKRDGSLVDFDKNKIVNAILKAMKVGGKISKSVAEHIAEAIFDKYRGAVEVPICEIELMVFNELISRGHKNTAKAYEGYRAIREYQRENQNNIEQQVSELLGGTSDYWNNENSNKNEKLVTTQRDYMAGILSTNISRKYLLPPDIVQAHDLGIIHFHDIDYFGQKTLNNCCLINLDDMLQNGTCINGVRIDKPHRLSTATTIATQIILAVSSSQYGGCTITLTHLAPFVRDSYNLYLEKYKDRGLTDEQVEKFAKEDLHKEIVDAVQTFNYQVNSMTSCNGQAPFISVFMYIDENIEYKEETVMLIEEFLRQRIQGMKNKVGHYVTQTFPKLIYALDEDNIHEDSEYYWLTELAVESTAKRMNPDYVSAKIMKEYKGAVFPSMG